MMGNILAWLMVILAMPALLLGAVCMVIVIMVFALLAIPYVTMRGIVYLINRKEHEKD